MNPVTSAVSAIISDDVGRVLLCEQSAGHHLWMLPGGRIRNAESPTHAAVRDVREETGLETVMVDVVGIYQLTGDGAGDDVPDAIVYVFRGRATGGEAAVNAPGRICRLAWHDPQALPEPLAATTKAAIADAQAGRAGVLAKVQRYREPPLPDVQTVTDNTADAELTA